MRSKSQRFSALRTPHSRRAGVAGLGATLSLAACTQLVFTPSPGWSRLSPGELREQGDAQVRAECPRLVNSRPTGDASLTLTLDTAGAVTRAAVERGTGDARMDEIFGRLAVRLQFERAAGAAAIGPRLTATMGYSCAASGSAITFEVRQPPALERAPADTSARRPPAR